FHFTWTENGSTGGGRTSIWVTPSISLTFTFYGSREASINRHWLDVLMSTANSGAGLQLVAEPKVALSEAVEY
ncbi:MAG TPA: ATP-dependent DNA ligase, partial [Microbacterium sp.]|nr:ATP-dependent DNA ligase [Microbacterium sp.]